jgi:hypothetical protein
MLHLLVKIVEEKSENWVGGLIPRIQSLRKSFRAHSERNLMRQKPRARGVTP